MISRSWKLNWRASFVKCELSMVRWILFIHYSYNFFTVYFMVFIFSSLIYRLVWNSVWFMCILFCLHFITKSIKKVFYCVLLNIYQIENLVFLFCQYSLERITIVECFTILVIHKLGFSYYTCMLNVLKIELNNVDYRCMYV